MLAASAAMEAWGAEEDGIPDAVMRCLGHPDVNPWHVYLELNARACPATGVQNCHACARTECGDNLTEKEP
jgi:hypothetical protein